MKTILYVTWEQLAIPFLLVKSLFFDLTSYSRTWDYRSGISPAGSEKWLGPGVDIPKRKSCFSQRKKGKQRIYLAKVLMNKTLCVGRGNRVILVGQVLVDFHREQTMQFINWACTHLLELDLSSQRERQEDAAADTNRKSLF